MTLVLESAQARKAVEDEIIGYNEGMRPDAAILASRILKRLAAAADEPPLSKEVGA